MVRASQRYPRNCKAFPRIGRPRGPGGRGADGRGARTTKKTRIMTGATNKPSGADLMAAPRAEASNQFGDSVMMADCGQLSRRDELVANLDRIAQKILSGQLPP